MNENRLLFLEGPRAGDEVVLSDHTLVFGRSDQADVVVEHDAVSRRHMRILLDQGSYKIEDLGSRNGTYVNGELLQKVSSLKDGDEIRLGRNVVMQVVLQPEEAATIIAEGDSEIDPGATQVSSSSPEILTDGPSASTGDRRAILQIDLPGQENAEHTLIADQIRVGRLEQNDIVINYASISRTHFSLNWEGENYQLFVAQSASNPVYINDIEVPERHKLQNGDRISIGLPGEALAVVMFYRSPYPPAAPEPPVEFTEPPHRPDETELPLVGQTQVPGSSSPMDPQRTFISSQAGAPDAPGVGETVIGRQAYDPEPFESPQLVVNSSGKDPVIYTLKKESMSIGRHPENDIVIENRFVSRFHAEIEKRGMMYYIIPSASVGNPLVLEGQPVMEPTYLQDGAKLRINGPNAGEMVTLVFLSPHEDLTHPGLQKIEFSESKIMTVGRASDNDIVLDAPSVSRIHAQVERIGQRYRVKDLNSSNGTFVNGQLTSGETWVNQGDAISVGPYRILVGEDALSSRDESEGGMRIEAYDLNKWVRKDLNIIQNISLAFQPREFIVVVGQSGGGKSSLVDAIAGYRPATHGRVMVNDSIDVYKEFDAIRNTIGYVPQKDIIHMELTVFQALDYAAQLRMAADSSVEERHKRIAEVMEDLDLSHRRDTQISELSGGQQKRVSIGVELITKPGLFFLDEPTSGLDPGMETELMHLMRRLADQGRTIVLITHATKNVMLADRVVFLARGGYLTWFGPPDEALAYFDQFRSERQKRTKPMEFDDIYTLLDQDEIGKAEDWANRFRENPKYEQYISQPLGEETPTVVPTAAAVKKGRGSTAKVSALRQFLILSARNIKILTRDRATLALMLLSAPLMASLDFILAFGVGRNPFDFDSGDFNDIIVTLIVVTNTAILVGGLAMMRELVKEREIYKRERMVNLLLSPYIFSKLWFALILALYQTLFFVLIRHLAFDMPHGPIEVFFFFITVFLMVTAGMMMGLLTSAVAPNANAAPLILVLFILPQMVLSGALVPLPDLASAPASSRWAFQAVIGINGSGSDIAGDACWSELSQEERDEMTLEEKNANCACMGVNALRQESCDFPGLGEFYKPALDEPKPLEPVEPGPEPDLPEFPDGPEPPENLVNPQALQLYFSDLEAYNTEVETIQSEFEADLDAFRGEQENYKDSIEVYQGELTDYETDRASAVGSAEATIKRFYEAYGWTFADKTDTRAYLGTLFTTWGAQLVIIIVLFVGTLIAQKRRDVT